MLALTRGKAEVLEFQRSAPDGRIQVTSQQVHTIHTTNYRTVRVLHQEKPSATLKVSKDLPALGKKTLTSWTFETGFIRDLPWDLGEWHWRSNPPMGDAPFFGYTARRGYINNRPPTRPSNMISFIQGLHLRNTSSAQLIARLWHNARPCKVGTLIWLTLNQGLPVGTWLQLMGIPPQCKVCNGNAEETPNIASWSAQWFNLLGTP